MLIMLRSLNPIEPGETRMEEDTLKIIIETERQIRDHLEDERRKAREWLQNTRERLESEYRSCREALTAEGEIRLKGAEAEARREVEAILEQVEKQTGCLDDRDEDDLTPVVRKHLTLLDPRSTHDRSNGEG